MDVITDALQFTAKVAERERILEDIYQLTDNISISGSIQKELIDTVLTPSKATQRTCSKSKITYRTT